MFKNVVEKGVKNRKFIRVSHALTYSGALGDEMFVSSTIIPQ
jgi:hypothetical protein